MTISPRGIYTAARRLPILGVAVSRLVWAVKGLLGRPVTVAVEAPVRPPSSRPRSASMPDLRLRIALEAIEALRARAAGPGPDAPSPVGSPSERSALSSGAPGTWSVVIVTVDRADWLDRALHALAHQRHDAFEVLVVRGPCQDRTDEVLARHGARVRVLTCARTSIAAARNIGLTHARGEGVAFLDDDAVPEPDWLERLGEGLADPRVAGVGGFIRDAFGVGFQCRTVVADRFGASRDIGDRPARVDPPGPGVSRYLSLTGANCGFRRRALLEIGGFDEAYAYFLDETDVCLRLVEAGWRLASVAAAEVHHGYAESTQRDARGTPRRLYDCARSTAYFAFRHGIGSGGAGAVVERLDAYALGLIRDTRWREANGVVCKADADRMLHEIEAGVSSGVRAALSAPSATVQDGLAAMLRQPPGLGSPPILRGMGDRLRLALICRDYPERDDPERPAGGIAVWSRTLAEALAARGHEVTVLRDAADGVSTVAFRPVERGGLWLHRVASGPEWRRGSLLRGVPASVAAPAQALAREALRVHPRRRFDLALGPLWDLQSAGLVGAAPFPVAVSLHTACAQLADDRPDWSADYRRDHVNRVVAGERRLLSAASHVLANSPTALGDIAARFQLPDLARRAEVLAHGLPDLSLGVSRAPRRGGVEFLFVGRLERRKGIDVLLDAAPAVLAAAPSARLTLVGEIIAGGDGAAAAEAFRRRHAGAPWITRVDFVRPVSRGELLARYAACDVVLAPSRYESFGLVALEAMIFAKPCVVGDAGGSRDVVVEGETGLRVAAGDVAALAEAMLALANDPGRRLTLGRAGRRRYEAHYTETRMVEAFEAWAFRVAGRTRLPVAAE